MNTENNLTIDWEGIEGILKGMQVDIALSEPIRPVQDGQHGHLSLLVLEQMGLCRLSEETRRLEEERLAKLSRKKRALRERKPYTRKRGTVHPKKKAATRKRALARRWARDPYSCLCNSYGYWTLDRKLFDEHILPLWSQYEPADLTVKRTARGTAAEPHTVFNIKILHRKDSRPVFDGSSLELYLLSSLPAADKL